MEELINTPWSNRGRSVSDSILFSNLGSSASILGVGILPIINASCKVIKKIISLNRIKHGNYKEPLKKKLLETLKSLASGNGVNDFVMKTGLNKEINENVIKRLANENVVNELLIICSSFVFCEWPKCKEKHKAELETIRQYIEDALDLEFESFDQDMEHLVPLLVFCVFNDETTGERHILKEISGLHDKICSAFLGIESRLDFLCSCHVGAQNYDFNTECVRSYAFISSLPFLKKKNIVEILCEAASVENNKNYLKNIDEYIRRKDAENLTDDILSAVRCLDTRRQMNLVNDDIEDVESLIFLMLVCKSKFESYSPEFVNDVNKYKCDYHDMGLRDLDAMLSPVLGKQYDPRSINRYYYIFGGLETGFSRLGEENARFNEIYNALMLADFDETKMSGDYKRRLKRVKKNFATVKYDKEPHYYFMVFEDVNDFDISKTISRIIPEVVIVSKSNDHNALRIIQKEDFEDLLDDMANTLVRKKE